MRQHDRAVCVCVISLTKTPIRVLTDEGLASLHARLSQIIDREY